MNSEWSKAQKVECVSGFMPYSFNGKPQANSLSQRTHFRDKAFEWCKRPVNHRGEPGGDEHSVN
jgi:hypothetical protein